MLSNTCKYAIRAMIYLAVHSDKNKKIGIKAIAEDLKIPSPFLGKIMQLLSKNKLLISTKGPNGGFFLGKNANDIKLMEIVKIIDGTDFFDSCILGMKVCFDHDENKQKCPFHDRLDPLRDALLLQFEELSVGYFKDGLGEFKNMLSF